MYICFIYERLVYLLGCWERSDDLQHSNKRKSKQRENTELS